MPLSLRVVRPFAPALRALSLAAFAAFAAVARAQPVPAADSAAVHAFQRATARVRVRLAADRGGLWGRPLDGAAWIGVAGGTAYATAEPHGVPFTPAGAGLWRVTLPAGVSPANTTLALGDRRWAMVVLPLPDDARDADRLLVHELFHAVQPDVLPLPAAGEGGAGASLLEAPEGRTWLALEWRALARALEAEGRARDAATTDALLFRARRLAVATPDERDRERLLDLSEGMAEYTALSLVGGGDRELARRVRAEAPARASWTRAFPYYTGPAYGLLAEARGGRAWTRELAGAPDLQLRMAALLGPGARGVAAWLAGRDTAGLHAAAERAGRAYGLDSVREAERARGEAHARRLATLRAAFVDAPTLRLRPATLAIRFDPGRQISLGEAGTVMGGLAWRSDDGGSLQADDGALVSSDWRELRVPLGDVAPAGLVEGTLAAAATLAGPGWRLTLPAGWRVSRDGRDWVVRPPS